MTVPMLTQQPAAVVAAREALDVRYAGLAVPRVAGRRTATPHRRVTPVEGAVIDLSHEEPRRGFAQPTPRPVGQRVDLAL